MSSYSFEGWNSLLPSSSSYSGTASIREFSFSEIEKATNSFDPSLLLGRGWMSEIYKGTYHDYDGKLRTVTIKAFNMGTPSQQAIETWFERGLEWWSFYRHDHIVPVIGYCREFGLNIVVYEHMVNGNLAQNLSKKITPTSFYLSWEQCLHICLDVARGLEYMQAHVKPSKCPSFFHGDVTPTNILLDENSIAKISDLYYEPIRGRDGEPAGYFDPESHSTGRIQQSSDVYAFGVLLVKVLSRKVFFDKEDENLGIWFKECIISGTIMEQIIHPEMKAEILPDCLKAFIDIADECLNNSSMKRPSITQVMKKLELLMGSSSRRSCERYSLHEVVEVTNNFESVIGQGGEGMVYKGVTKTNTSVAVKRLKSQFSSEFVNEFKMLSNLDHPNLVSLVGYCHESDQNILIYELMTNGNLAQSLYSKTNHLSWTQRLDICIGAARGLRYLHTCTNISRKGIIHRDVKPVNILLDDNFNAKISDFGLSKMGLQDQTTSEIATVVKGTVGYYAPEYQKYGKITRRIDVYAFGVVLSEVLCRKKPWDREESFYPTEDEKYEEWAKENIDPHLKELISPICLETFIGVMEKCLNMNPNRRPSINEVVSMLEYAQKWQEAWERQKYGGEFCLPGSEDRLILYCTLNSQSSINARLLLRRFKKVVEERDVVTDLCLTEIYQAMGNSVDTVTPQLFVQGKHVGNYNEMEKLYGTGKLAELLGLPQPLFICDICQKERACDVCKEIQRYVHCNNCGALTLVVFCSGVKTKFALSVLASVWCCMAWQLWVSRNKLIFEGIEMDSKKLFDGVLILVWSWLRRNGRLKRLEDFQFKDWYENPKVVLGIV